MGPRLLLVGAGPVGVAAAEAAVADGVVTGLAAVVDPDEEARRRAQERFDCRTAADIESAAEAATGDWALVAFSSRASATSAAIRRLLQQGYSVVTTCEELSDPAAPEAPALAAEAREQQRVVIATGANPGFVMDRLVVAAAGGCRRVRSVRVSRRVDTARRRGPLVAKTGRGLSPAEFDEGVAQGTIGHVGLGASARLVAAGLGWSEGRYVETIEPVVGGVGSVNGLLQHGVLRTAEGTIELDLVMAWEADDPGDIIEIAGEPPLRLVVAGGYHGDSGTTAQAANAIAAGRLLAPGFYRPVDLPLLRP